MGRRIARFAMIAAASAGTFGVALTPSMANAAQTWFTVQLPASIDMTWCEPAGCANRSPLPPTSVSINNAVTEVVAVPGDPTDPYRHASLVSYGYGSFAATQAVYALQASAAGHTWAGYNVLPPDPTVVGVIMLRNPSRPNGGLFARVAPAAALFGIDTVTPPSTNNPLEPVPVPTDQRLLTSFIDVAREYDGVADFPATANPISIANAVAGAIFLRDYSSAWPVVLDIHGDSPDGKAYLAPAPDRTVYYTEYTRQLPLLEPLRLIERIISRMTGSPVRTPIADAFEPALTILVNIGYTDVQTPSEGGTYNRTLDQMHVKTPFMSTSPLTAQEWAEVPGDVLAALAQGIHDVFQPTPPAAPASPEAATLVPDSQPTVATGDAPTSAKTETSTVETSNVTTPDTSMVGTSMVTKSNRSDTSTVETSTVGKPTKRSLTSVVTKIQSAFTPTKVANPGGSTVEPTDTDSTLDRPDSTPDRGDSTSDGNDSTSDGNDSASDGNDSAS